MNGATARLIRERIDRAFELLGRADATDLQKMTELWAILSDIQLWMEDVEQGRKF